MKKGEQKFSTDLIDRLDQFRFDGGRSLNFDSNTQKTVFARQVRDSIRRIEYIKTIGRRAIDHRRADPTTPLFDPIKGAVHHLKQGSFDEACWLTFIGTHFGKDVNTGWSLAQQVYGALGGGFVWNWNAICGQNPRFRDWMAENEETFLANSKRWKFSNHRKYQSMKVSAPTGTATVFESYVEWVQNYGSHRDLFLAMNQKVGQNPADNFDCLFKEMDAVKGFGRLAKFDHLTMLSKVGVVAIEPPSPYIQGSTGPRSGAEQMFNATGASANQLNDLVIGLGEHLEVGMQVMEDALCNWQKSTDEYKLFMG